MSEDRYTIGAVVLMAGRSTRMVQGNKLLQFIPGSGVVEEIVAEQTIRAIQQASFSPIVVVTGHDATEIEKIVEPLGVQCIHNAQYIEGMGTSISVAFEQIDSWDAALLALGDMPFVSSAVYSTLRRIAAQYPKHILVPTYNGKRGHPVVFPSTFFPQLRLCTGDVGAKYILQSSAEHIRFVEVNDESIFWDVDTHALLNRYAKAQHDIQSQERIVQEWRRDVPALKHRVHDKPLVYMDWAATTQVPQCVIDATMSVMALRGSVRRGVHQLSADSTDLMAESRTRLAEFIGGDSSEVIFTSGTTDGFNRLIPSIANTLVKGDVIVLSAVEHHAHLLPWQKVATERGLHLEIVRIDDTGRLCLHHLQELCSTLRVRVIGFPLISNVLGVQQPVAEIVSMIEGADIRVVVDAAQAVAHIPLDVSNMGVDAVVFGGHKMYGPAGVGVLWVASDWLSSLSPSVRGGGAIQEVSYGAHRPTDGVVGFEPGTPNVAAVAGLARAAEWLSEIGWGHIQAQEQSICGYLQRELSDIPNLRLLCSHPEIPLYSVVVDGLHAHDLGTMLDLEGVAVRTGHHCTQPFHDGIGVESSTRLSLSFLNTLEECHHVVKCLKRILEDFV